MAVLILLLYIEDFLLFLLKKVDLVSLILFINVLYVVSFFSLYNDEYILIALLFLFINLVLSLYIFLKFLKFLFPYLLITKRVLLFTFSIFLL